MFLLSNIFLCVPSFYALCFMKQGPGRSSAQVVVNTFAECRVFWVINPSTGAQCYKYINHTSVKGKTNNINLI